MHTAAHAHEDPPYPEQSGHPHNPSPEAPDISQGFPENNPRTLSIYTNNILLLGYPQSVHRLTITNIPF